LHAIPRTMDCLDSVVCRHCVGSGSPHLHMASIYKLPSGLWRAQVARSGVRKSATFDSKRAAQLWAADLEAELMSGKRGEWPRRTVAQALDKYAQEVSPRKRGGRWEIYRINAFKREPWAALWMTDLAPQHIADWRDRRVAVHKPESVRRDMTLLSSILTTAAKEWRWIPASVMPDVRKPDPGQPRTRLPGWRELRKVLRVCGYVTGQAPATPRAEVAYLALLALRTAMRKGELIGLRPADVDTARSVAYLRLTKNGDARAVPLSAKAVRLLNGLGPRMFTVTGPSASGIWRRACNRAGVEDLRLHDARAGALTSMSKRVDALTLARVSGHKNLSMLLTYYRASPEEIAKRL
jgi:integrase